MGWTCFTISLLLIVVLWLIGRKAQPERKQSTAPPSSQPPSRLQHGRGGGEVTSGPGGCTPPGDDVRSLLQPLERRLERLERYFAGTPAQLQMMSQRLGKLESPQPVATSVATSDPAIEDAVSALVSLGEKRPAAERLVIKVRQLNPDADANQLIAEILRTR
jgi:hypothetical protein